MDIMPYNHRERLNVERCEYILGLPQERLIDDIYDIDEINQNGEKWNMDDYFNKLKYFLSQVKKNKGIYNQSYKYSKNLKDKGRQYVKKFGIQSLQRDIRGFLCQEYYNDYDIVNAHPSILLYIQKTYFPHTPPLTHLEKYVNDRDNLIKTYKFTKKDVLVRLNSSTVYQDESFLLGLSKEFKYMQTELWNSDIPEINSVTKIGLKRDANKMGRFINRVLCVFENKIIGEALSLFNTADIGSVMFDGFFLNKDVAHDDVMHKLDGVSQQYGIKWTQKNHSDKIVLDPSLVLPPSYVGTEYEEKKNELEKNHFFLHTPFGFYREGEELECWQTHGFSKLIATIKYKNERCETVPLFDDWIQDPERREYFRFVFDPLYDGDENYNLFTGFNINTVIAVDEREQEYIDSFINHVKYLVRNDKQSYEYILNYCAHLIQKPQERPDVAILLNGVQGTGKDTLINFLEEIIGKKYVKRTSKVDEVFGNFNVGIKNKFIIQLSEMDGLNGLKYEQRIKDLITTNRVSINEKNMGQYDIENYARLFFCSNAINPIQINMGNRRFFAVETATEGEKKPLKYFIDLNKSIKNPDVIENVYSYLMTKDISNFEPRQIPETTKMRILKEHSVHPIYFYLRDNYTTNDTLIPTRLFISRFREYCITEQYNVNVINARSNKSLLLNMGDAVSYTNRVVDGRSTRVFVIDAVRLREQLKYKMPTP